MSYKEGTCPLPYPDPSPAPREEILAHCYKGHKCWWQEGLVCFNPIPDNPRYPHRAGAKFEMLTRPDEIIIDKNMIEVCGKNKWRQFTAEDNCNYLNSRCSNQEVTEMCSIFDVSPIVFKDEDQEEQEREEEHYRYRY